MNIVRWNPFAAVDNFNKDVFGDLFSRPIMNTPTTDIYVDNDKELVVEAHVPGFNEDEIEVNVNDGHLEIRAEHQEKSTEGKRQSKQYVLRETSQSFYRSIRLPRHADESKVDAHLENGLLKVKVPFRQLPKAKKIAVKTTIKKS